MASIDLQHNISFERRPLLHYPSLVIQSRRKIFKHGLQGIIARLEQAAFGQAKVGLCGKPHSFQTIWFLPTRAQHHMVVVVLKRQENPLTNILCVDRTRQPTALNMALRRRRPPGRSILGNRTVGVTPSHFGPRLPHVGGLRHHNGAEA